MLSLREIASKYRGITGGFSVVRDIFGVAQITGPQSLRAKLDSIIVVVLRKNIPGLDGWVEVTLYRDGTVRFRGHVHRGGVESSSFRIRVIGGAGRVAKATVYEGHAGGFQPTSGDPRDEDWDRTFQEPMVRFGFADFQSSSLEIQADTRGDITGWLEDVGTFLARWVVGSVLLQPGILTLIVLGGGAGSLITTGGFTSGARLIGGTLWLAGPGGTLVALASEGVAALGSREREISEAEFSWADQEVFRGTLPSRHRIILTDIVGGNNRPFVFPRFDGKITVNLGKGVYQNPLNFPGSFVHELVHKWQLENTYNDFAFIATGISTQVCMVFGSEPYDLPPGTPPFADFNLEQQAQAVQTWFLRGKKPTDPYYKYIVENVRTGTA
jgi:hypothetical protein